jgi:hypothetical protein
MLFWTPNNNALITERSEIDQNLTLTHSGIFIEKKFTETGGLTTGEGAVDVGAVLLPALPTLLAAGIREDEAPPAFRLTGLAEGFPASLFTAAAAFPGEYNPACCFC